MKYIIHGATGAQGGPLYKKMLNLGKEAVAAVRDTKSLEGLPGVVVDNASVESLAGAYKDADGVFIHLPIGGEEMRLQYAKNISQAVGIAKPKRVVISTSGWVVDAPGTPIQYPDENSMPFLIREIQKTGVSTAVLAPRLYLENLLLPITLEKIKSEGVLEYPIREDYAVSWSSHLDVADAALELFSKTSVTGIVGVGQQPAIFGKDLAAAFSKHFGRAISFKSIEPQAYGKTLAPLFGEIAAAGVAAGYVAHAKAKHNAINENTSAQTLLGVKPRTIEQWLAEVLGS